MIFTHYSRVFGVQLPIQDGDTIRVVDASYQEIAVLDGMLVRQILEHHLAAVALQHALGVEVHRPIETPYRRALARITLNRDVREMRAVDRRSRKRIPRRARSSNVAGGSS